MGVIRFADFELDLCTAELSRAGLTIRLQEQPFQILALLLEYSGKVVTRQDVRQKLWPDGIFVNFDDSINSAVKKLRQALNDSAEKPSILETLPRRGYRLIVPVERTEPAAALSPAEQVVFAPRLAVLPFKEPFGK